ncbi:MAG: histidine phosphatase family protein [Oscillospiraceae bacterium]|jgi:alpha-ribazole phosphatase|nr:histidine phosphatase family protein [Oscillospiraceae bacterium]
MTIYLIRHGQTRGNLERRYMGVTDQPLCPQGRAALADWRGPEAEAVYVSPLLRCRETAALLYPGAAQTVVPGLRETDFGAFEGRTYEELQDSPAYRAWLDSAGQAAPPGGESKEQVRRRVLAAFRAVTAGHAPGERLALVVHGGTIMTLLEALEPGGQFYRWQAPNGGGFRCRWDGGVLTAEAVLSAGGETPVL